MARSVFRSGFLLLALTHCLGTVDGAGGAGSLDASVGGGASISTSDGGTGLPCDVAALLAANCTSCHGQTLTAGAPYALVTLPDLLAASSVAGATRAQRSLARMNDAASPMPPAPRTVPASAVAAFAAWVNAGSPEGHCDTPIDAAPAPTTCASNSFWAQGNEGDVDMNPGYACIASHLGHNFQNQNPRGERKSSVAFQFMGTLFPSLHEKDRCEAQLPSGVTVEILDKNHALALTIGSNPLVGAVSRASGNFFNLTKSTAVQLPYTARVRYNGKTLEMTTPQTSGDCNSCHTEQGLNGAPGRVTLPQ